MSDAEASFLDLHLSISDGFVKTKIYYKQDDFDFDIVNLSFLDGDVPRSASYGVYISQRKAPPPPIIFIAGRPKAALLFWFFGDFKCGALLFMVIHVRFKYKIYVKIVVKC